MIDIHPCYCQCPCCMFVIYHRLYSVGISPPVKIEVMGDELIFPCILFHNIRLPLQIIIHQRSLKLLELRTKTSVNCSTHIRKIFPRIDPVAPVVQSKRLIHRIQIIVKLCPQVFDELFLHIFSRSVIIFCLIIQLEADDTFSVCRHLHQFPDHPFPIITIYRMCDIHDLTRPVDAWPLLCGCQYIRMRFYHPGRDRIGRCSDDHRDARFFHRIQYPYHVAEIKHALLRFTGTPGGLCDTHQIDPCCLHHLHIFGQSVTRHILIIICHPIQ